MIDDLKMTNQIKTQYEDMRDYNLFTNNCSQNVAKILEIGGFTVSSTLIPNSMKVVQDESLKGK